MKETNNEDNLIDRDDSLEKERIRFLKELENQENQLNNPMEYKEINTENNKKRKPLTFQKMYRTLVISAIFSLIIIFVMKLYTGKLYSDYNDENLNTYLNVIQLKVNQYKNDTKKCPINSLGDFDLYALKSKGYIDELLESKLIDYTIDKNCKVGIKSSK